LPFPLPPDESEEPDESDEPDDEDEEPPPELSPLLEGVPPGVADDVPEEPSPLWPDGAGVEPEPPPEVLPPPRMPLPAVFAWLEPVL
jgi:hypothetical protein